MKTPLRYLGGKSRAFDLITPHVLSAPYPKRIISPFLGGGSLESRWSSERMVQVLGFDIFRPLVTFWQILLSRPYDLYKRLSELEVTKDEYERIKELLTTWEYTQDMLSGWSTKHYEREKKKSLTDLEVATYFYYNQGLSYGPQYLGFLSSIYLKNPSKWGNMALRVKNYKNSNLKVEENTFDNVIPSFPKDTLYLDPPYYLSGDMFKGLYPNPNFAVHHKGFDHELLRDLLHSHSGKFVLSYNDCPEVREYYKGFDFYFPKWSYSLANGETRIGANRDEKKGTIKESHEILIVKR